MVDVYRGTIQAQKNIFHLALYISFFPQLIADRSSSITMSANRLGTGSVRRRDGVWNQALFLRTGEKMLFANTFAATVDWMMEKPLAQLGTVNAWMLAVLYTLQIYFDFSGYSDMASRIGKNVWI